MVSLKQKRSSNVYEDTNSSDDNDELSDYEIPNKLSSDDVSKTRGKYIDPSGVTEQFQSNKRKKRTYSEDGNRTGKRQRCFSKNALMARENRIKKKLYLESLEQNNEKYKDENKKLSSILSNQSAVISDLRKEVKYLKNVLANSSDITVLLKAINQNTGLPVTTSLSNKTGDQLSHPWAETKTDITAFEHDDLLSGEFFPSDFETDSNWNALFSDLMGNEDLAWKNPQQEELFPEDYNEHNYTSNPGGDVFENAGVCLHIARHKVSLEFCASCSENAISAWNED